MTEAELRALAGKRSWQDRATAAKDPDLPEDLLRFLARDWSYVVRSEIAARADLPEDLRGVLVTDSEYRVVVTFARRPDLTVAEAEALFATRGEKSILAALAATRLLPEAKHKAALNSISGWDFARMYLAGEIAEAEAVERVSDPHVALTISRHVRDTGQVSDAMFERLLRSTNPYVIENLAASPVSADRLARVAEVGNSRVRIVVAGNVHISDETAEKIMLGRSRHAITTLLAADERAAWAVTHPNAEVRLAAAKHMAFTHPRREGLVHDPDPKVRKEMVSAALPTEVLDAMCHDEDAGVRGKVAKVTPSAAHLRVLAQDSSAPVRAQVAARADAGVEVLTELADDPAKRVRETAATTWMTALGA